MINLDPSSSQRVKAEDYTRATSERQPEIRKSLAVVNHGNSEYSELQWTDSEGCIGACQWTNILSWNHEVKLNQGV